MFALFMPGTVDRLSFAHLPFTPHLHGLVSTRPSMATTQNPLLSRLRSVRLASTKNTASTSSTTTTSTGNESRSKPLNPSPGQSLATVSNISLFLTNLRLLELDLLPDWPDINSLTFTNRDLAQGQKKRIQCVEWALYQLFSLWDPEETHNVRSLKYPARNCADTLTWATAEITTLLPTSRPSPLRKPTRCPPTMSRTGQEEWRFRERCCVAQDYVGRVQRREA